MTAKKYTKSLPEDRWSGKEGRTPEIFLRDVLGLDLTRLPGQMLATPKQRYTLYGKMYEFPDSCTRKLTIDVAAQLIELGIKRKQRGVCSLPQARELWHVGLKTDISFKQAKLELKKIKDNGWNSNSKIQARIGHKGVQAPTPTSSVVIKRKKVEDPEQEDADQPETKVVVDRRYCDRAIREILGVKLLKTAKIKASGKQLQFLSKLELETSYLQTIAYTDAQRLLDACAARKTADLCKFPVAFQLWKLGFPFNLKRDEANRIVQKITTGVSISVIKKEMGIMEDIRNEKIYLVTGQRSEEEGTKGQQLYVEKPLSWFTSDPEFHKMQKTPLYERPEYVPSQTENWFKIHDIKPGKVRVYPTFTPNHFGVKSVLEREGAYVAPYVAPAPQQPTILTIDPINDIPDL